MRKGVDLIVLNDVSRADIGFDVDHNEVVLVARRRRRAGAARAQARDRGARCSTASSSSSLLRRLGRPVVRWVRWRPHSPSRTRLESARDAALRVIANVRLAVSGEPARSSSAPSSRCWPRGTCSSRTSRASARRRWRARSRARSTARSRASSSRPTCCRATSPASSVFDQRTSEFAFRPGPVFANVVLADEINRASPRTQSALLECMQERQVTVDGVARPLAAPFFVIATQNPIEQDGTFPLPEAQLDRFALRLALGYPAAGRRGAHAGRPDGARAARRSRRSAPVADAAELIAAVHACRTRARRAVAARLRRRALRRDARGCAASRSARARARA